MKDKHRPVTVDEYITQFPEDVQRVLHRIRAVIRTVAPEAQERLSYGMPGYYLNGKGLVWFAAWKRHIGFYPVGGEPAPLQDELATYRQSKGGVQFPLHQPIPYDLIHRLAKFRVAQNSGLTTPPGCATL